MGSPAAAAPARARRRPARGGLFCARRPGTPRALVATAAAAGLLAAALGLATAVAPPGLQRSFAALPRAAPASSQLLSGATPAGGAARRRPGGARASPAGGGGGRRGAAGRTCAGAAAGGAAAGEAPAKEWRAPLRTLLLSLSEASRREALKQLQALYEVKSPELIAEIAEHGRGSERRPWLYRLRARPLLGYRSACASLYRTMVEHVLPEQAGASVEVRRQEGDEKRIRYVLRDDAMEGDGVEGSRGKEQVERNLAMADSASQARALFVLLRQLPDTTAWALEEAAALDAKAGSSSERWLERTPKLETPKYQVIFEDPDGVYEIRRYSAYSVVETDRAEDQPGSGNRQFFKLANYIFGKANEKEEKMAMTTPVQTDAKTGAMSFIMPSTYWGADQLQAAPAPKADAGVRLVLRPAETVAVTVFGGYARAAAVAERKQALLEALGRAESLEVPDQTATRLMQYNDPFTVPWKRRNEVSVPVLVK